MGSNKSLCWDADIVTKWVHAGSFALRGGRPYFDRPSSRALLRRLGLCCALSFCPSRPATCNAMEASCRRFITTPLFLAQNRFDANQIHAELLCPAKTCTASSTGTPKKYMDDYGRKMEASLRNLTALKATDAVWSPNCLQHTDNLCMRYGPFGEPQICFVARPRADEPPRRPNRTSLRVLWLMLSTPPLDPYRSRPPLPPGVPASAPRCRGTHTPRRSRTGTLALDRCRACCLTPAPPIPPCPATPFAAGASTGSGLQPHLQRVLALVVRSSSRLGGLRGDTSMPDCVAGLCLQSHVNSWIRAGPARPSNGAYVPVPARRRIMSRGSVLFSAGVTSILFDPPMR